MAARFAAPSRNPCRRPRRLEIDEGEAEIVREVFDRYTERGESIADIARALSANGVLTRTGKQVWDRSTVWAMLRNPAYHGQAAFGKTQTTGQRAKAHPSGPRPR